MNWQISVSAHIHTYIYYVTTKVIYDDGEKYIHDRVYNRYEGEVLTDFEKDLGGRTDVRRSPWMWRKERARAVHVRR